MTTTTHRPDAPTTNGNETDRMTMPPRELPPDLIPGQTPAALDRADQAVSQIGQHLAVPNGLDPTLARIVAALSMEMQRNANVAAWVEELKAALQDERTERLKAAHGGPPPATTKSGRPEPSPATSPVEAG